VLARIREACAEGQQAYWVCPVIEESRDELQTALDTHATLTRELRGLKVGLVHGRMSAPEKNRGHEVLLRRTNHVLVATTVIEVGVDVPNASLMVIEHAERFGLAQLHQLRGASGAARERASASALRLAAFRDGARAPEGDLREHRRFSRSRSKTCTCAGRGSSSANARAACRCCRYADPGKRRGPCAAGARGRRAPLAEDEAAARRPSIAGLAHDRKIPVPDILWRS